MSKRLLFMELGVSSRRLDDDGLFVEAPIPEGKSAEPDPVGLAFSRCLAHELGHLEGWAVIGTGTPLVILENQGKRSRGRGVPPAQVAREALDRAGATHLLSGFLELLHDYRVTLALQDEDDLEPRLETVTVEGPDLPALLAGAAESLARRLDAPLGEGPRATPPPDLETLRLLGRGVLGHDGRAARLVMSVLRDSPRCGPALFAHARTLLDEGKLEEVLATTSVLVTLAPNDPAARALHGYALLRSSRSEDAVVHLRDAVALVPSAPAHAWLGIALDAHGEPEAAEASFSSAHALNPRDAAILHDRAVLRLKLGRYADARGDLERASALDPTTTDRALDAWLAALRGEAGTWVQDPGADDALLTRGAAQLASVVARRPEDAIAWFLLGVARKRLGELPEAAAALRRAAELDPRWPYPHLELAAVAAQDDRRKDAIGHARDAIALAPDDPLALGNLGALLLLEGGLRESEELLRRSLALDARNELAARALEELERLKRTRKAQLRHLEPPE